MENPQFMMTPDEIERVAERASEKSVNDAIARLFGSNPQDSEAGRKIVLDFIYLRKSREGQEELARWVKRSAIGVAVSGGAWALWEGFKAAARLKGGS